MKNSTRALTAALAAGLAFGVAAPQSFAKPGAHGLSVTVHGSGAHGKSAATQTATADTTATTTTTTVHGKAAAAKQHKSAHLTAKALREAARKQKALTRVVKPTRLAHLTDEWAAALKSNVAEDQAGLDAFVATLSDQAVTADAAAAAVAGIHAVRPEGYLVVENQLRHAARLLAEIGTAPTAPVTDPTAPATGTDTTGTTTDTTGTTGTDTTGTTTTDPTAPVTEPAALVASAVEKALAYRADHPKSELRAIQRDLAAAEAALDGTDDTTDGTDDTTDGTDGTDGTGTDTGTTATGTTTGTTTAG